MILTFFEWLSIKAQSTIRGFKCWEYLIRFQLFEWVLIKDIRPFKGFNNSSKAFSKLIQTLFYIFILHLILHAVMIF